MFVKPVVISSFQKMYLLHNNDMYPPKKEKPMSDTANRNDQKDDSERDGVDMNYDRLLMEVLDLENEDYIEEGVITLHAAE